MLLVVETSRVTDGQVSDLRAPNFDPLEVSEYLENGLLNSALDKWFVGPLPKVNPSEIHPAPPATMGEMLSEMRKAIEEASDPDFVDLVRFPGMNSSLASVSSSRASNAPLRLLSLNCIMFLTRLICLVARNTTPLLICIWP